MKLIPTLHGNQAQGNTTQTWLLGQITDNLRTREIQSGKNTLPKQSRAEPGYRSALVTQESLCVLLLPWVKILVAALEFS